MVYFVLFYFIVVRWLVYCCVTLFVHVGSLLWCVYVVLFYFFVYFGWFTVVFDFVCRTVLWYSVVLRWCFTFVFYFVYVVVSRWLDYVVFVLRWYFTCLRLSATVLLYFVLFLYCCVTVSLLWLLTCFVLRWCVPRVDYSGLLRWCCTVAVCVYFGCVHVGGVTLFFFCVGLLWVFTLAVLLCFCLRCLSTLCVTVGVGVTLVVYVVDVVFYFVCVLWLLTLCVYCCYCVCLLWLCTLTCYCVFVYVGCLRVCYGGLRCCCVALLRYFICLL